MENTREDKEINSTCRTAAKKNCVTQITGAFSAPIVFGFESRGKTPSYAGSKWRRRPKIHPNPFGSRTRDQSKQAKTLLTTTYVCMICMLTTRLPSVPIHDMHAYIYPCCMIYARLPFMRTLRGHVPEMYTVTWCSSCRCFVLIWKTGANKQKFCIFLYTHKLMHVCLRCICTFMYMHMWDGSHICTNACLKSICTLNACITHTSSHG